MLGVAVLTLIGVVLVDVQPSRAAELMAGSGGGFTPDAFVGINNAGTVAFTGTDADGSKAFISTAPGVRLPITFFGSTRNFAGAALNNAALPQVATRDRVSGSPPVFFVRRWDSDGSQNRVNVGRSPNHFDSAALYIDINDSGVVAFSGLTGGSTSTGLFAGNSEPPTQLASFPGNIFVRPQISNTNEIVARDNANRILVWTFPGGGPQFIAGPSAGFSAVGPEPGISADGAVVGFGGERAAGGGIFASVRWSGGRTLVRVAGEGADSVQNIDYSTNRIGVNASGAVATPDGLRSTVVFVADLAGRRGVYAVDLTAREADGAVVTTTSCACPVVRSGEAVAGRSLGTSFRLFDPINSGGTVALWATFADGGTGILRATPRRIDPLRQCAAEWGTLLYAASGEQPPDRDRVRDLIEQLRAPGASPAAFLPPSELAQPTWSDAAAPFGVLDADDLAALADRLEADRSNITICAKGCALTSFTMAARRLLDRQDTPANLHLQLAQTGQITAAGGFQRYAAGESPRFIGLAANWAGVHQYFGNQVSSQEIGPISASYAIATAEAALRNAFDAGSLAILNVNNGGHWVFAGCYRVEGGQTQFNIIDPGRSDGSRDGYRRLADLTGFRKARVIRRTGTAGDGPATGTGFLQTSGPIRFLLTDPAGLQLGTTPGGEVFEIAEASFSSEYPIATPEEVYTPEEVAELEVIAPRVAFLNELRPGRYQISFTGLLSGAYAAEFTALDAGGATVRVLSFGGVLATGESETFDFFVPTRVGDLNCDGAVNFDDLGAFVLALVGEAAYTSAFPACEYGNADIDGDGRVDFNDISGFVTCLATGVCE